MSFTKLLTVSALVSSTSAWWGDGHMLVARIAQSILEKQNPASLKSTEAILSVLKKSDPSWTTAEGNHPFVECSSFADDIKYKGGSYQSGWHFVDEPYLDEGGKITDYNFTADAHNITEAISSIVDMFEQNSGWDSSYIYD